MATGSGFLLVVGAGRFGSLDAAALAPEEIRGGGCGGGCCGGVGGGDGGDCSAGFNLTALQPILLACPCGMRPVCGEESAGLRSHRENECGLVPIRSRDSTFRWQHWQVCWSLVPQWWFVLYRDAPQRLPVQACSRPSLEVVSFLVCSSQFYVFARMHSQGVEPFPLCIPHSRTTTTSRVLPSDPDTGPPARLQG